MSDTSKITGATGTLTSLKNGVVSGLITLDDNASAPPDLTIEVSAHGIVFASHTLAGASIGADGSFSFQINSFPGVALPCNLRARIVETDTVLDTDIAITNLEDLWTCMIPFSVTIEEIQHNAITLKVEGTPDVQPVFRLLNWGKPISTSTHYPQAGSTSTHHMIPLPYTLLDGSEHRLSIVHEQSGLPVSSSPISLRLQIQTENTPMLGDVLYRLEALEKNVAKRYADAFNAVTVPIYRHIDTVTMYQRSNFEREISAMRRLLAIEEAETAPETVTQSMADFGGPVIGYGVHGMETTSTGKTFRSVSAAWGVLVEGITPAPARLVVQGLRRRSDSVLDNAKVLLNGVSIPVQIYLNPKSESWNITADVPAALTRADRNLVELRLSGAPQAETNQSGATAPLGVMYVSLSSTAGDTPAKPQAETSL